MSGRKQARGRADADGYEQKIAQALDAGEPLRCDLGRGARLHIDRPLPFIVIHKLTKNAQAARAATAANASYLLFRDQKTAKAIIASVADRMKKRFGAFLVIDLSELAEDALAEDAAYLPPFEVAIAASDDSAAQAGLTSMASAIQSVNVKFRSPKVSRSALSYGRTGPLVARLTHHCAISLAFAPIYRVPQSDAVYPDLRERLVANIVDAVLQGATAFARHADIMNPASHRALGRQMFIDSVIRADKAMDEVASSFDFLLAVTPINAGDAFEQFVESGFKRAPRFLYRPLTVSAPRQKKALYSIDLDRFEDPVLSKLYDEKRAELDLQISMISARESMRFKELGRALYGSVEPGLLDIAQSILKECKPPKASEGKADLSSSVVKKRADAMIAAYANDDKTFDARVELRDDLPSGMMVSGRRLLISRGLAMPATRVEALLSHEVGVHLLTYFNGSAQGLKLFRSGLAGYEGVQEGLAVLAEYLVGGMTPARLRLIAGRVVACAMMLDGAAFPETFAVMTEEHKFSDKTAFTMTLRTYRGGGLAKDAVYLRGLLQILDHLKTGGALDPFWMGKIAAAHFPVIQELTSRGLLRQPRLLPRFLSHAGANERLEKVRSGLSPVQMIAA